MSRSREFEFLQDVEHHGLEVVLDQGVNRHLRFDSADVNATSFEIATWQNHLSITGDNGNYLFAAKKDMFTFFRRSEGGINFNPSYCSEKLLSIDRNIEFRHFDPSKFIDQVTLQFIIWSDENKDLAEPTVKTVWDEIQAKVIAAVARGKDQAYQAVKEFEHDSFKFEELLEVNAYTYNAKYLWCLNAICWGINEYDKKVKTSNSNSAEKKLRPLSPEKISDVRALLAEY